MLVELSFGADCGRSRGFVACSCISSFGPFEGLRGGVTAGETWLELVLLSGLCSHEVSTPCIASMPYRMCVTMRK